MKRSVILSAILLLFVFGIPCFSQEEGDFRQRQDSILEELRQVKPWYVFGNENYSLVPMAITALDVTYYHQDENSYAQVGDQDARYEPGQIRAVRFGVVGTIGREMPWRYILAGAYRAFDQGFNADSAADFLLYDLRVDIPTKIGTFAIGKTREPISMQRASSMIYLGGFERAMNLDAFLPGRNSGILYYNSFFQSRVYFAAGAFKLMSLANRIFWKEASTAGVARLAVNPILNWREDHDLHLGAGVRYGNFRNGATLRQHPEAYFASKFIDTGPLEGDYMFTRNYEFAYRYKSLLITSEITRAKIGNESLGSPVLTGGFLQADLMLTGEVKSYNSRNATFSPAMPGKNVQDGGWGALELTLRYSGLDASEGGIQGGEMTRISGFLTWYPTVLSKAQIGYGYVTLDRFSLVGHTHVFQFRFAVLIG